MYSDLTVDEFAKVFEEQLLDTNRGYNYYVDWSNISGFDQYDNEIAAIDSLIGCKDDALFKEKFSSILKSLPKTIELFPFLFALSKVERNKVVKDENLKIIGTEIDSSDYDIINFNSKNLKNCSQSTIDAYYAFFVNMGLKALLQNYLKKSVRDYIVGVLVGLDSNGRKNRGGSAFELACEPMIRKICEEKYGLIVITQKTFKYIAELYRFTVNDDIANRKFDFVIMNKSHSKVMNIEVNFYSGGGSKPEEIIDSYINRQNDLKNNKIDFALITDGDCWSGTTNQLRKGFNHLNYLMNYKLAKSGMLEEVIKEVFSV